MKPLDSLAMVGCFFTSSTTGRFLWLVVAIALSFVSVVFAQVELLLNCDLAKFGAEELWLEHTEGCVVDLSTCSTGVTCPTYCPVEELECSATVCTDGCSYNWGDYTVARTFSAGYGRDFILGIGAPFYTYGFSHEFTAGATGRFSYVYEGDYSYNEDRLTAILEEGPCSFTFNGVDCECTQKYCDEAQSIIANYIDCSALEGGAIIDNCVPEPTPLLPATTTGNLSLLELLYYAPAFVCIGTDVNSNTNSSRDNPHISNLITDTGTFEGDDVTNDDSPPSSAPDELEPEAPATGPTSSSAGTDNEDEDSPVSEADTDGNNDSDNTVDNADSETETESSATTLPPATTTRDDNNDSGIRGVVSAATRQRVPRPIVGYALLVLLVASSSLL